MFYIKDLVCPVLIVSIRPDMDSVCGEYYNCNNQETEAYLLDVLDGGNSQVETLRIEGTPFYKDDGMLDYVGFDDKYKQILQSVYTVYDKIDGTR